MKMFDYLVFNEEKKLGLDSREGNIIFISHAHADHAYAYSKKIKTLCSAETAEIRSFNGNVIDKKEAENYFNIEIELLNAGHMFGAKQLFVKDNLAGKSVLYTGDIRLRDNIVTKGAETRQTDSLIIDCTYGSPEYLFPEPFEVYEQMRKFYMNEKPDICVFMGYPTGKAQELVKFVNEYMKEIPVVDTYIAKVCRIMNKYNMKLEFLETTSEEGLETMKKGRYIAISSPFWHIKKNFHSLAQKLNKKCVTVYATGWAVKKDLSRICDKAFPLSDHCDFNELVEFVKLCNPKNVYCKYGFTREFANYLNRSGYRAIPYEETNAKQTTTLLENQISIKE
ncbi:MAG: MBL fold metallo-hydrolase [Candidatus Micrarchaeota archaeon]|nr:MBL fold metallo-hydrolase [Candidatus Micrarchaeota archaeon]